MKIKNNLNINKYRNNQVRIIGGKCRGRKLDFDDIQGLRPTADSVRERLFNWLGQDLTGKMVLDLFAGSGALGFEAASRSAKKVYLCDTQHCVIKKINYFSRQFNLENQIVAFQQDGLAFLCTCIQKFDVIFLDPPFVWKNWDLLFAYLKKCLNLNALVYIEASVLPEFSDYLVLYRHGKSGKSHFALLQYCAEIE